jgi:hypothetical protein
MNRHTTRRRASAVSTVVLAAVASIGFSQLAYADESDDDPYVEAEDPGDQSGGLDGPAGDAPDGDPVSGGLDGPAGDDPGTEDPPNDLGGGLDGPAGDRPPDVTMDVISVTAPPDIPADAEGDRVALTPTGLMAVGYVEDFQRWYHQYFTIYCSHTWRVDGIPISYQVTLPRQGSTDPATLSVIRDGVLLLSGHEVAGWWAYEFCVAGRYRA